MRQMTAELRTVLFRLLRQFCSNSKSDPRLARKTTRKEVLFSLFTFHSSLLYEHNRLRTRDFESAATFLARQHVVDSDHVVARFLISHPVVFVGAARRRGFLSSF